jgi:hypothetical protein
MGVAAVVAMVDVVDVVDAFESLENILTCLLEIFPGAGIFRARIFVGPPAGFAPVRGEILRQIWLRHA